ncbi:MFS transporter [Rhodococcus pyridinivorans]|uniref:MFS transporter n=1 Tax=Rhodococcus pyridinivorans TaxID=103816 RepID=UPI003AAE1D17
MITTAIDWRAAFVFQALIVAAIVVLSRGLEDPLPPDPTTPFDGIGAVLSAAGLVCIVMGILQADNALSVSATLIGIGILLVVGFFLHVRRFERAGRVPLLSTDLFRNRTSNLALVTQNIQWLLLMGVAFVVSAFLQVVRGYNAIETGIIFTAATAGILGSSLLAERLAARHSQRALIMSGFVVTLGGIVVLLLLVRAWTSAWAFAPGLLLIGVGLGAMLTPSVNVVQSAFPEEQQGEISGLSRCVSNLASSLGTAVAGTVLVVGLATPDRSYAAATIVLACIGLVGLVASALLPSSSSAASSASGTR